MQQISLWLNRNLLTLNTSKTKYLSFSITVRTAPRSPLDLRMHTCSLQEGVPCTCPTLEHVRNIKYLGVYIDERLSWNEQMEALKSRLRKLIYIFKRLRTVADGDTLKMVYTALCQSVLTYCITTWGAAGSTYLMKVERAQRAILKVAHRKPLRCPTDNLYNECKVLRVRQLYIVATILQFHRKAPGSIISQIRSARYNTWPTPKTNTKFANKAPYWMAPFLYNIAEKQLSTKDLNRHSCKQKVQSWLAGLTYQVTENILHPVQ